MNETPAPKRRRDTIKDFAPMLGLSGVGLFVLRAAFGATGVVGGAIMAALIVLFSLAEGRGDAPSPAESVGAEEA